MSDEQEIFHCGFCGVPILTFWAPDGGGLLRGEYVLAGDVIFHPKCFDRYTEVLLRYVSPLRDLRRQIMEVAREHPTWSQVHEFFQMVDRHLSMMARLEEINQNKEMKHD